MKNNDMRDIDIDAEMNKVFKQFKNDLKDAHVLDENDNVINDGIFEEIVDKNIARLNELEKYVSNENGVVTDRYGYNILGKNIQLLRDMKACHSLNPQDVIAKNIVTKEPKESRNRSKAFFNGIAKLFNKRKKIPQSDRGSR